MILTPLRKVILTACVVGLLGLMAAAAFAQQLPCGPHDTIVAGLASGYQEFLDRRGVALGALIEIFASEKGTWTMLATGGNGISCVAGAGDGWDAVEPESDHKPGQAI